MLKFAAQILCFGFFVIFLWQIAEAQTFIEKQKTAVFETKRIVREVINESFPELSDVKISVKTFGDSSDFFRSRFSINRFFTFRRMHYLIFVNPQVYEHNAPNEAIRAIIAHELAHTLFFRQRNRFALFGLIKLESDSYPSKFEHSADLQAIKRGYGAGLKSYREWLYRNIPTNKIRAKKRDYFSLEEIDLILQKAERNPSLINSWKNTFRVIYRKLQNKIKNNESTKPLALHFHCFS